MQSTIISPQFAAAIDLRINLMLASVFRKHGVAPDVDEKEISFEAMILGYGHSYSEGVRRVFEGTLLEEAYLSGRKNYEDLRAEVETSRGSKAEWDALSSNERAAQWDEFHEFCAQGIADKMYFYRVMMDLHQKDYVGH